MGKRIFEAQTELIYKIEAKTDIAVRLFASHKNLYQSRLLLFPIATDTAFQNRIFARMSKNVLFSKRSERRLLRFVLCSSFLLAALFHKRFLVFSFISRHIYLLPVEYLSAIDVIMIYLRNTLEHPAQISKRILHLHNIFPGEESIQSFTQDSGLSCSLLDSKLFNPSVL